MRLDLLKNISVVNCKLKIPAAFSALLNHFAVTDTVAEDVHGTWLLKAIATAYAKLQLLHMPGSIRVR
jgi:hypothetical protein